MFCLHLSMETFSSLRNYPTMGKISPALLSLQSEEMNGGVTRFEAIDLPHFTKLQFNYSSWPCACFSAEQSLLIPATTTISSAQSLQKMFLLQCSQKVSSCPCAWVANVIYSNNFPSLSWQNKLYCAHVPRCELSSICCSECGRDYLCRLSSG